MNRQLHCWKQPAYFPAKLSIPVNYLRLLAPPFFIWHSQYVQSPLNINYNDLTVLGNSCINDTATLYALSCRNPRTKTSPNVPYTNPLLLKEVATGLTSPLPLFCILNLRPSKKSESVVWNKDIPRISKILFSILIFIIFNNVIKLENGANIDIVFDVAS